MHKQPVKEMHTEKVLYGKYSEINYYYLNNDYINEMKRSIQGHITHAGAKEHRKPYLIIQLGVIINQPF